MISCITNKQNFARIIALLSYFREFYLWTLNCERKEETRKKKKTFYQCKISQSVRIHRLHIRILNTREKKKMEYDNKTFIGRETVSFSLIKTQNIRIRIFMRFQWFFLCVCIWENYHQASVLEFIKYFAILSVRNLILLH